MGQYIERLARVAGDEIHLIVDESNREQIDADDLRGSDVAIEFSRPEAAVANIDLALAAGVPIVVGTTGWLNELPDVAQRVRAADGALFWASNFSIGVNVFFAVAEKMAALLGSESDYTPAVEEIHHLEKLDAPSGTAITLAETVAERLDGYASWRLDAVDSPVPQTTIAPRSVRGTSTDAPASSPNSSGRAEQPLDSVPITSIRRPDVPGTHTLRMASTIDTLELKHTAHGREGFARGALAAARFLVGKKGVFTMADLLGELK